MFKARAAGSSGFGPRGSDSHPGRGRPLHASKASHSLGVLAAPCPAGQPCPCSGAQATPHPACAAQTLRDRRPSAPSGPGRQPPTGPSTHPHSWAVPQLRMGRPVPGTGWACWEGGCRSGEAFRNQKHMARLGQHCCVPASTLRKLTHRAGPGTRPGPRRQGSAGNFPPSLLSHKGQAIDLSPFITQLGLLASSTWRLMTLCPALLGEGEPSEPRVRVVHMEAPPALGAQHLEDLCLQDPRNMSKTRSPQALGAHPS